VICGKYISPDAQEILVNMGFNLGLPRLSKFTQLREALRGQDYLELQRKWKIRDGIVKQETEQKNSQIE
jgi:hypothetical protein